MSYYGSKDCFSWRTIKSVERSLEKDGETTGESAVAYEAMKMVNNAEDNIRRAITGIRQTLENAEQYLDNGLNMGEFLTVDGQARDLAKAMTERQAAFQFLAAVLSPEEIKAAMAAE
jgi:hypothetical protein